MSSNIRITRICEFCNTEFIARTIQTRYCSHQCNSKAYKKAKRNEKLEAVVQEMNLANPLKFHSTPVNYSSLSEKEFLTIDECSLLLNITSVTLRRWIKDGIIETNRLGKKHIIQRGFLNVLLGKSAGLPRYKK